MLYLYYFKSVIRWLFERPLGFISAIFLSMINCLSFSPCYSGERFDNPNNIKLENIGLRGIFPRFVLNKCFLTKIWIRIIRLDTQRWLQNSFN